MGHDLNFAALIGSRICHDLISPIGAINNGIELIEMSAPSIDPEMALISESVVNASARIRFFRIAFGAAGEQLIGRPEVLSILQDTYAAGRLNVACGPLEPQERRLVRLAFLALMCVETTMPYGGRLEITQHEGQLAVTGVADKFKLDPVLWGMLSGTPSNDELRPAHVQFGLLPLIAADEERPLHLSTDEQQVTIRV